MFWIRKKILETKRNLAMEKRFLEKKLDLKGENIQSNIDFLEIWVLRKAKDQQKPKKWIIKIIKSELKAF